MSSADTTAVVDPPGPPPTTGSGLGSRSSSWMRAHPGLTLALVIPFAVVLIPQLFGHTFLDGDNLIQNLPMRYLTGLDLSRGHLPLWNPYLFGGTPLLGGFNAGSAYPATWMIAFLPLFTAWSLTLVVAYDVALVGMYLFLRRQPMATTPATFGAVTFTFAGYMTGQLVHIDLIEGAAWLPWMLVAVHALTGQPPPGPAAPEERRSARRALRRWAALLAVALGMSLLAGGAEAIIDSGVLVGVYLVGRLVTSGLLRRPQRRALATSIVGVVVGLAGGVALGAAQWVPGLIFLSESQRSATSYTYFTSGSLNNRLVTLLVSPSILGTNQGFPASYVGTYNFPEVTGYMGILALIAACSLFLRRYRRRPEARHCWVWYVILVVGLLSSLGNQTPFGRLMYLLPGIKSERLLNRNLLLVDMALAVLLAWWVHLLLDQHDAASVGPMPSRWRDRVGGGRAERMVTCAPLVVMAVLAISLWVTGPLLGRLLETQDTLPGGLRLRLGVLVTAQVVVAGAATWIVLTRAHRPRGQLARSMGVVLVADLALFNLFVISPPITEAKALAATPAAAQFHALVGDGRFIIYDPERFENPQLMALGQTDLNIYHGPPSAQGYTALTDGTFYNITGSHLQEDLNPETLAGSTWDGLNVSTLLSLPGYFITPVPGATSVSAGQSMGGTGTKVIYPADINTFRDTPEPAPTTYSLTPKESHQWYFGNVLTMTTWDLPISRGTTQTLRLGLVTPSGGTRWLPRSSWTVVGSETGRTVRVSWAEPEEAAGVVVQAGPTAGATVGVPEVTTLEAGRVLLDGRMQVGVTGPHWTFEGTLGSFGVFHNTRSQGWASIRGLSGSRAPSGSTATAGAPGPNGGQTITVHTTAAAMLERSASWSPGWEATIRSVSGGSDPGRPGPAHTVAVTRNGVLQQVAIPGAGEYLVRFSYAPSSALWGLGVSGAAFVALAGWGSIEWVGVSRRRRRSVEVGAT